MSPRLGVVVGHPAVKISEAVRLARMAEDASLDLVSAGDGAMDNIALMGALAQATTRVQLLTGITSWTRTPVTTALAATTLADLSDGRYCLGLGSMPPSWSADWHDTPHAGPVHRMRDFVAAVRSATEALPGHPTTYDGTHYRFVDYERQSSVSQRPPIYLGATLKKMTTLAGEIADGVLLNTMSTVRWIKEYSWPALKRGLNTAGRDRTDLDVGVITYCAVSDESKDATDMARHGLAFYFGIPYFSHALQLNGFMSEQRWGTEAALADDQDGMVSAVSDRMVQAFALAGSSNQILSFIRRYDDLVDFIVLAAPLGLDASRTIEQTERTISLLANMKRG